MKKINTKEEYNNARNLRNQFRDNYEKASNRAYIGYFKNKVKEIDFQLSDYEERQKHINNEVFEGRKAHAFEFFLENPHLLNEIQGLIDASDEEK